jgi:Ulp1 family protease
MVKGDGLNAKSPAQNNNTDNALNNKSVNRPTIQNGAASNKEIGLSENNIGTGIDKKDNLSVNDKKEKNTINKIENTPTKQKITSENKQQQKKRFQTKNFYKQM